MVPDYCEDCATKLRSYRKHDADLLRFGASTAGSPFTIAGMVEKAGHLASKALKVNTKERLKSGRIHEGVFVS